MGIFVNTKVTVNPKYWHPFGCPVYVLDSKLQIFLQMESNGKRRNLHRYINHNKTLALILSRQTCIVSPQHHIKCDYSFQTMNDVHNESLWQTKVGFVFIWKIDPVASKKQTSCMKIFKKWYHRRGRRGFRRCCTTLHWCLQHTIRDWRYSFRSNCITIKKK